MSLIINRNIRTTDGPYTGAPRENQSYYNPPTVYNTPKPVKVAAAFARAHAEQERQRAEIQRQRAEIRARAEANMRAQAGLPPKPVDPVLSSMASGGYGSVPPGGAVPSQNVLPIMGTQPAGYGTWPFQPSAPIESNPVLDNMQQQGLGFNPMVGLPTPNTAYPPLPTMGSTPAGAGQMPSINMTPINTKNYSPLGNKPMSFFGYPYYGDTRADYSYTGKGWANAPQENPPGGTRDSMPLDDFTYNVGVKDIPVDDGYYYPGYSYPGYSYPGYGGYSYPEQAKSWYENMTQWRIS